MIKEGFGTSSRFPFHSAFASYALMSAVIDGNWHHKWWHLSRAEMTMVTHKIRLHLNL